MNRFHLIIIIIYHAIIAGFRFAITVWYYDAIEKAAALEREGHEFNQKNVVDKRFSTLAPTINPQKNLEKHQVVVAPIPLSHPKESHTSVIQHNHTGVCPLETTIVGGINKTQKSTDMER